MQLLRAHAPTARVPAPSHSDSITINRLYFPPNTRVHRHGVVSNRWEKEMEEDRKRLKACGRNCLLNKTVRQFASSEISVAQEPRKHLQVRYYGGDLIEACGNKGGRVVKLDRTTRIDTAELVASRGYPVIPLISGSPRHCRRPEKVGPWREPVSRGRSTSVRGARERVHAIG